MKMHFFVTFRRFSGFEPDEVYKYIMTAKRRHNMQRTNAWKTYDPGIHKSCMDFADDYKAILDH